MRYIPSDSESTTRHRSTNHVQIGRGPACDMQFSLFHASLLRLPVVARNLSSIHTPAEFSGLGERLSTLVRKNGSTQATLNEISTGQRAAFALSIILAQNAQLRVAPPVILIDDPVARVDDLNALSFLDYLREIVLAGKRQIFFATASDKLATLFQRKFDFMGDNFRRHDLRR